MKANLVRSERLDLPSRERYSRDKVLSEGCDNFPETALFMNLKIVAISQNGMIIRAILR